jgi:hypothetical protein
MKKSEITLQLGPSSEHLKVVNSKLSPAQRSLFRRQLNTILADIKDHFDPKQKCGWPLDFGFYKENLTAPIVGPVDMFFAALLLENKLEVKLSEKGKFVITKKGGKK